MNYGKFFRLSQRLSKIEEGIAIYDYMDLPAYFDSGDISKRISPKYPISISITEDCVRFRVHYSAYKIENNGSPEYLYDLNGVNAKDSSLQIEPSLKHIEETILELPYTNDSTDTLSRAIKQVYETKYPQTNNFVNSLISKRYEGEGAKGLEKSLYDNLRKNYDEDVSYSTLWLMGISNGSDFNLRKKENTPITGFLRKLLLDFMFDLRHTDVFQTSKYYQQMYSGLMENFFFSALMHKCEYYYQRGLVEDLIGRNIDDIQKKEHIKKLYAEKLFEDEELWVNDIMNFEAENHFMYHNDNRGLFQKILLSIRNVHEMFKPYQFKVRNSWFAAPEEEMRRVCFTTEDSNGMHACNMESLCHYLRIKKYEGALEKELIEKKDDVRARISNWFLKRYSISDVMHIHLFRGADIVILGILALLICGIFIYADFFTASFWENLYKPIIGIIVAVLLCSTLLIKLSIFRKQRYIIKKEKERGGGDTQSGRKLSGLIFSLEKQEIAFRRTASILLLIALSLILICSIGYLSTIIGIDKFIKEESAMGTGVKLVTIVVTIISIFLIGLLLNKYLFRIRWLSNMHVFMPRLIASIAAAWLSLAIGNELFGTFFDSIVSWSTCIWLLVIVFAFVMYVIDMQLRRESVFEKFERCMEMMIISYAISIVVGMFIINFTGERFLERSGQLEGFYSQYLTNKEIREVGGREYKYIMPNGKTIQKDEFLLEEIDVKYKVIDIDSVNGIIHVQGNLLAKDNREKESISDAARLKKLSDIYIVPNSREKGEAKEQYNHPISTIRELPGGGTFFILRDFLIQFSFMAMFIGIFITMLFEGKSITEV